MPGLEAMSDDRFGELVTELADKFNQCVQSNTPLGIVSAALALILSHGYKSTNIGEDEFVEVLADFSDIALVYFNSAPNSIN